MKKAIALWSGITILIVLAISYFIKINVDQGANFIIKDSFLGIIIFHNPFILAFYLLMAIVLIKKGHES